jgi:GMP synthase (glutamine-hydrolysing)
LTPACSAAESGAGTGSIQQWLERRAAAVQWTRFFQGDTPPDGADFDWLIVMGGPMSVSDETAFPWIAPEKLAILGAIQAGKRVLGICLGAQLVAAALGARVSRGEKEIGWYPVRRRAAGAAGALGAAIPDGSVVFHWHGDTFDIPPGALGFLSSDACANQAFQLGERVLGLQFHLETTVESARALVENCGEELVPGAHLQDAAQILARPRRFIEINRIMGNVLDVMSDE